MTLKHSQPCFFKSISVAGFLVAGLGVTVSYADDTADTELKNSSKLSIAELNNQELIELLSDEDYSKRQLASDLLWRRGKSVLQALEEAVLSKNPELISRASTLINYIKVGVSPETEPHITVLVQGFDAGDEKKKLISLRELYTEREYSLMLFMLSELNDKKMSNRLYAEFPRLAHNAARESIIQGDVNTAIEQLKLAPKTATIMRSLAYIYQLTGRTDVELENLKKLPEGKEKASWKRNLYLAKRNRSEIRKYAKQENLAGVIANLDLLDGDATKMVDFFSDKAPFEAKLGVMLLKAQYSGANEDKRIEAAYDSELKKLELFEGDKPTSTTKQVFKSMAMTGAAMKLEPYMVENYKNDAFTYFNYLEQPKRALATIGITDDASLTLYIGGLTEKSINDKVRNKIDPFVDSFKVNRLREQLLDLTDFYYDRGLYDQAKSVISPLLTAIRENNEEWCKLIERISHKGMHDLAIELIVEDGNDNQAIFGEMVTYLYDDTLHTDLIWLTLDSRAGVSKEQSFRDLGLIMGVEKDKIKPYLKLQDELQELAKQKGVDGLTEMREALLSAASFRQDSHSHVRFAKLLLDEDKEKDNADLILARKGEYLRSLLGIMNNEKLVEFLDEENKIIEKSAEWYSIYSIAKRNLGDVAAAEKLLKHAKTLSLGLYDDLRQIAAQHAIAGYDDISTEIMEQCLIAASLDRNKHAYEVALGYLSSSDNAYIKKQQWGKAAAFMMVDAVRVMIEDPDNVNIAYTAGYSNMFFNLSFTRGMELYQKGQKVNGLKMLKSAHEVLLGNGVLADYFYPATRTLNLGAQYDAWVEGSYELISESLVDFPDSANTRNMMAWLLSRAVRKLDEALMHSSKSRELNPFEPAYIDTTAEVWHAKGDRKKAIEWGEKAVSASMYGKLDTVGASSSAKVRTYNLAGQLKRFRSEPHPKP